MMEGEDEKGPWMVEKREMVVEDEIGGAKFIGPWTGGSRGGV